METSELTGATLNWAVAKCEEWPMGVFYDEDGIPMLREPDYVFGYKTEYSPSTDWAQGGPIIEREKITVSYMSNAPLWVAHGSGKVLPNVGGPTPLIAAMRCYVASKLGNEVEVPEELCTQ